MTTAAATLLLSAAGCAKLDRNTGTLPDSGAASRPIAFPTPLVSSVTKASTGRTTYPEDSSFGVYGLYYPSDDFAGWESTPGASLYIDGAKFAYNASIDDATEGTGAWISNPAYYWLPWGKMTFAAWSPYSVKETGGDNFSYGATGLNVKDFDTTDGDRDLMYSERVYDKTSSAGENSRYDGIDLVFHHALSALNFNIRSVEGDAEGSTATNAKVEITKIVAWGFSRKGTFSENVNEDTATPGSYSSDPTWTIDDSAIYTAEDPLVLAEDDPTIFVIPQSIGSGVKIKVYYTVTIGSGTPVPAVPKEVSLAGNGTDDDIPAEWKMATRYNYNLILGATQIRFSVDVRQWGGESSDIND